MNARQSLLAACSVALLGATAAQAQGHIKPGLWENTITMKSDNPAMEQMKARMAAMSPEQRAQMEKLIPGMAPGGAPNSIRVCITKEQAARDITPDNNGRCSRTNVVRSGDTTQFDFACKSARSDVSGHGSFTRISDNAYTATSTAAMVTKSTTTHMTSDITSKFISSDCGDVKPIEPTPAR
jgi:hypothetical protein